MKNTKTDFLDPTYEGGDAWVPGSAVLTSANMTHAHLVCSKLSLKVLAW